MNPKSTTRTHGLDHSKSGREMKEACQLTFLCIGMRDVVIIRGFSRSSSRDLSKTGMSIIPGELQDLKEEYLKKSRFGQKNFRIFLQKKTHAKCSIQTISDN